MKKRKKISQVYQSLVQVINDTFSKLALDILIKTEWGTIVYGRYLIRQRENDFEVVLGDGLATIAFNSIKLALLWAILDYNGKISDATRIQHIDKMLEGVRIDVEIHKRIAEKSVGDTYYITYAKLQHDLGRQRQFIREIDKYTILAQQLCENKRNRT